MNLIKGNAELHFATPTYSGKFGGIEVLNTQLKKLFLEYERTNVGNKDPLNTTLGNIYDSEADIFNLPDEPVRQLRKMMHGVMSSWVKQVNNYSEQEFNQLKFRYESWFHITRKGGCKTLHNHGNFSWAMVYYVNTGGESSENFPRSGMIQFYDPRRVNQNNWEVGLKGLNSQAKLGGFSLKPEAGSFIIFPGYIDHEVLTYHGDSERIMVAVNCSIVTPDAPSL